MFGKKILNRVCSILPEGAKVTDIGAGAQSTHFINKGFAVTGISLRHSNVVRDNYTHIQQRVEDLSLPPADCVFTCMTVEHMPNVGLFLQKCRELTKPDGLFAIVAPSDKSDILVDGHLTFWTPAHLIYNLVINGWDCSGAEWYTEGRDIGLLVRRKDRPEIDSLTYDRGDLYLLREWFPVPLVHRNTDPWLEDSWRD